MPAAMSVLRASTEEEHRELEDTVAISSHLTSVESYRRLLEAFYGFVAPIEAALARHDWEDLGVEFSERRKLPLIEADLRELGSDPDKVPHCEGLPEFADKAAACGAFYVMEGSTLGGQHISRMARNIPGSALRYFQSYGERVGEMWKAFGASVNEFAERCGNTSRMVEGARATFVALERWFQSRLELQ
jgi:heme oxygenase (biliverdin-IX-beta and delta-forming)